MNHQAPSTVQAPARARSHGGLKRIEIVAHYGDLGYPRRWRVQRALTATIYENGVAGVNAISPPMPHGSWLPSQLAEYGNMPAS